jgi:uncharacterized protein (DUF1330 family)
MPCELGKGSSRVGIETRADVHYERDLMPVYLIIEISVRNLETYSRYVDKVFDIISRHGGRYLARGGKITPLSGGWHPERIILIEFDATEQVEKCFGSAEYLEIAPLREQSTMSRAIIVDGYSPPVGD